MSDILDRNHAVCRDPVPLRNGLAADVQAASQFHRPTDDLKRLDEGCILHGDQCKPSLPFRPEKKVSFTFLAGGKQRFHNRRAENTRLSPKMTLGKRLKSARLAAKLTQAAVATSLGITRPAVTQWESDTTIPELENLKKLADLYGVSVTAMLGQSPQQHDRLTRALDLMSKLPDDDQEWYLKSLERDVEKTRRSDDA